jgi:lysophospholipase L1-like esterase
MQWYESEVAALERRLRALPETADATAFYGSSSFRLWTGLARDLGDARAINAAFGGSTLAACVHFFDRLIAPINPASLVVYAGDNDLGDGRGPEDVLQSFRSLVALTDRLPRQPLPFAFLSIKLSPARLGIADRIHRANALIREEIACRPNFVFIDIVQPMLGASGLPRAELFLPDGLHLSPAGYRVWVQVLEPYRNQIFIPSSPEIRTVSLFSTLDEPRIS